MTNERHHRENDMGMTISGARLPMTVLTVGLTAIFTSVIYATIWLTKLDDRVLDNTAHIAELHQMSKEYASTLSTVQSNCQKQTLILDSLAKRVEKIEK